MAKAAWNRIDKATGQIFATTEVKAREAAATHFSDCDIYDDLGGPVFHAVLDLRAE